MFSFLFDTINIALLATAFLNLMLGVLIFVSGKGKKINVIYGLNIVAIISWILAMFFYRSSPSESDMFWCTVLYVVPTLIASSFLYFTYIFPSQKEKRILWRVAAIFALNIALIVMVVWPGLIIEQVNARPGQEKQIVFSEYYWFYFLYTLSFFSFGFLRLFKKYFKTEGIERLQIIYLGVGYALAANLAFATNLLMPWIGLFFLNWLGQIFSCIMVGFTAYAILRYRLMDIRIVFRRVMVFFISSAFVYGAFYLVIWFEGRVFGGVYAEGAHLFGLIMAPVFVFVFARINAKIKGIANKYLFYALYDRQEAMAKLTSELTNSIDLDKIIDSIVNSIKDTMRLDRAGILVVSQNSGSTRYKIAKVVGFKEKNGISLVEDNFLTQYLQKTQKPLVRGELSIISREAVNESERKSFAKLAGGMEKIEASLCLPMIISNKLIGIIVLGSKISGDAYTSEDLSLLDTLSKQASIAVDNARLYKEVQNFSKNLEQKVAEQTKEIRGQKDQLEKTLAIEKKAHEMEKHANEELRRLDQSKTDFMVITQHHLRTPLSVNAGFVGLLLSGALGKIPAKAKNVLVRLEESNQKGIDVVNELLDISSYQIGKEIIDLDKDIDFPALMDETLKDLRAEAENKGIYLKYAQEGDIPKIPADRTKLKLVLTNVIDNCIKYTVKGGISVNAKAEKGMLRVKVEDTGIGLSADVLENLFKQTFHRGEQAERMFAVGKGLGLYFSGKIIEAHHGKIWAESRGEGKGSTFNIELPLNRDWWVDEARKNGLKI